MVDESNTSFIKRYTYPITVQILSSIQLLRILFLNIPTSPQKLTLSSNSVNYFQGNEMKKIISLAANFSQKLKQIVGGIKAGVQFFKDLISGRLSLKKIVDDIIDAITSIPKKVNI